MIRAHGTSVLPAVAWILILPGFAWSRAGNICRLVLYKGRTHGFFNFGRGDSSDYRTVLQDTETFLVEQGCMKK